ncbi:MAG: FtsQ-type POTRA domain-containing protein [Bacillota bacterium]|nr:FtsQ-type POTRA domain-containing protein [Bacillota bacterium]
MGDEKRNANELIRMRKKKRRRRKISLLAALFIIVSVILCLKLSYFNIARVEVLDNKIVAKEDIIKLSGINPGKNIFYLNKKDIKNKVLSNSYISEVSIKRQLPSTVVLDIKERIPRFHMAEDKDYILLDAEGYVLDRITAVDQSSTVQVLGLKTDNISFGKRITDDQKKLREFEVFDDMISRDKTKEKITSLDISDNMDIKVCFNNITVKVGNIDDMQNKLNKAINIISQQNLTDASGYIDVSYNGVPVISVQK